MGVDPVDAMIMELHQQHSLDDLLFISGFEGTINPWNPSSEDFVLGQQLETILNESPRW